MCMYIYVCMHVPKVFPEMMSTRVNSGIQHVEFRVATLNSHLEISKFEFSIWAFKFRNTITIITATMTMTMTMMFVLCVT